MDSTDSGLGKATKKTSPPSSHAEATTALPRDAARPLIESTLVYELEWSELREVVAELRELLPPRYRPYLHAMPEACPTPRWRYDIGVLLEKIALPVFSRSDTTHFVRHFAREVKDKTYLLVCLKALLENGVGPFGREEDVECALWFVQNPISAGEGGRRRTIGSEAEPVLVSPEALAAWTARHEAETERKVGEYSRSNKGTSWSTRGLLRHLGYRVGQQGEPPHRRHEILTSAVLLPDRLLPTQHLRNWGRAGTATRVGEVRGMIALFRRLASGRSTFNMTKAMRDWQNDLDWLAAEFRS